jgi:DNA polymerase III subunit beta
MNAKTKPLPRAKKVAANPQHKMLVTAMKKCINTNTVLPILEDVLLTPGFATVTDLENTIVLPFNLRGLGEKTVAVPGKMFQEILDMLPELSAEVDNDFGVKFTQGARTAKVMGENPDDFPKTGLDGVDCSIIGRLTEGDMENLATAMCFVSGDDLRPAMTGVFFEAKKNKKSRLVATDAHRLYWNNLSQPIEKEFILPPKAAKILLAFGGEWEIASATVEKEVTLVSFTRPDGLKVIARAIDARFPDYRVVLPEGDGLVKLTAAPEFLMKEFKNAGKFANRSTNQVTLGMNGKFSVGSQDIDFSFEYHADFENKQEVDFSFSPDYPKQYTLDGKDVMVIEDHGSIVEIRNEYAKKVKVNKSDLVEQPTHLYIAFNGKFMQEIINKIPADSPVEIEMWSPTKCAIINKHYLIMPLMLNQ